MAKAKTPDYPTDEVYLTDIEVAARIGIAVPTVWRWAKNGKLPEPVRFSFGCVRFPLSEVLKIEGRARTPDEVSAEAAAIRKQRMDDMRRERSARWRRQEKRRQAAGGAAA